LLDWLKTRRHSGAFLITGNRGVGKSTFVDACVENYVGDLSARIGTHPRAGHLVTVTQVWLIGVFWVLVIPWLAADLFRCVRGATQPDSSQWVALLMLAWVVLLPLWNVISDLLSFRLLRRETKLERHQIALVSARWIAFLGYATLLLADALDSSDTQWFGSLPHVVVSGAIAGLIAVEFFQLRRHSAVCRLTFLGGLYDAWLPVIRAKVNLGFDNLDQTTVARAMLTALVHEHRRTLTNFSTRTGRMHLGSAVILVLGTVNLLMPLLGKAAGMAGAAGACLAQALPLSAKPLDSSWPLREFLPFNETEHQFALSALFGLVVAAALCLTPLTVFSRHTRLNRRARNLLRSLDSATRRVESGIATQVGYSKLGIGKAADAVTVETGKLDPRQIEQEVLRVISDMARSKTNAAAQLLWFAPSADIIFIFDELDKVGNHRLAVTAEALGTMPSHFGSERNRDLHRLLSEMKNFVSSAEARFIFIGGRDLDDEWLADRTARKPLLSTVFEGELYLPSLLVDAADQRIVTKQASTPAAWAKTRPSRTTEPSAQVRKGELLLRRTVEFLQAQRRSAKSRANLYQSLTALPARPITWYVQSGDPEPLAVHVEDGASPVQARAMAAVSHSHTADPMFEERLYRYLTIVGRGNPKNIESLLDEFVSFHERTGKHTLRFGYADRFRIAFFARIFDRVAPLVAYRSEDKVIQSAFYLTEFLFKFHNRAFHWSSLELLDELLDVHHAPDLRQVMTRIVNEWAESYIVRIEAGLYRFRFGSAFAAEIRYLSRLSSSAMATFNFTLDETYLLKQEYERRLRVVRERGEDEFTTRSALGELYDFDEDYQQARQHYFAAIQSLDQSLTREYEGAVLPLLGVLKKPRDSDAKAGSSVATEDPSALLAQQGRAQLNWSVPRIFNRLRIGLTYERTGDHVDALVHYRNARTLANSALADLLSIIKRRAPHQVGEKLDHDPPWRETTKDLQLLFEPMFACAWIAEKSRGPSSGRLMLEQGVRYTIELLISTKRGVRGDPFWLSRCDLHLKTADFYLLRGNDWREYAYSHYEAAARCVGEHRKANRDGKVTPEVALRLAPALLGMADVCFANCEKAYSGTSRTPLPVKAIQTRTDQLLADLQDVKTSASFGLIKPEYTKLDDLDTTPTNPPNLDEDCFLRFIALSDAAAQILRDAGALERAERVWLTTRRNVVLAAWAIRVQAHLAGDRTEATRDLTDLAAICSMPFELEETFVPRFRERLQVASEVACRLDSDAVTRLRHLILRDPYPVRGALALRENLLLYELLSPEPAIDLGSVNRIRELMRMNGEFDSPMHFTPSSFGLVVGFWALIGMANGAEELACKEARHQAMAALSLGMGTVTRQSGYRTLIAGLYYLDDGYSDREVHVGHSQQMFLYDLSRKLFESLRKSSLAEPAALP